MVITMVEICDFWRNPQLSWMSNFYPAAIVVDGRIWPSVEHYYQAHKFQGTEWFEFLANQPTAAKAKTKSRKAGVCQLSQAQKELILFKAVKAKFSQHPDLKALLLATSTKWIVEGSPKDRYWGTANGSGLNRMGELLMELRAHLINDCPITPIIHLVH